MEQKDILFISSNNKLIEHCKRESKGEREVTYCEDEESAKEALSLAYYWSVWIDTTTVIIDHYPDLKLMALGSTKKMAEETESEVEETHFVVLYDHYAFVDVKYKDDQSVKFLRIPPEGRRIKKCDFSAADNEIIKLEDREYLIRSGSVDNSVYLVEEGVFHRYTATGERTDDILVGSIIGEMSFFSEDKVKKGDVISDGNTVVKRIAASTLQEKYDDLPMWFQKIITSLVKRANKYYSSLQVPGIYNWPSPEDEEEDKEDDE
jgi:hypothetical protein